MPCPAAARLASIITVATMLLPPMASQVSDGETSLTQGTEGFQNATRFNATVTPQGMRLPYNETCLNNWTRMNSWPDNRWTHFMAYDSANGVSVLFGGIKWLYCNETWVYNHSTNTWTERHPKENPGGATSNPIVYDSANGEMLLYYYYTWSYNVSADKWTSRDIRPGPAPNGAQAMAYDSANKVAVLFGGLGYINETWLYNSSSRKWTNAMPAVSPPGRSSGAMVYDSINRKVALFGGEDQDRRYLNDTWTYDVSTNLWTNQSPTNAPSNRTGYSMVFDSHNGKAILFGGADPSVPSGLVNDTWTYDLATNTWTEQKPSLAPLPRCYHGMSYDSGGGETVLFGGNVWSGTQVGDDTWTYNLSRNMWTRKTSSPSHRYSMGMTHDDRNDAIILFGGKGVDGSYPNDTWTFDTKTGRWTERRPKLSPPGTSDARLAFDSANGVAVLFGNPDLDDYTWTYDLSKDTWTSMHPNPAPTRRNGHVLSYDSKNGMVIMYGGCTYFGAYLVDTWTYNISNNVWEEKKPASHPPARWCPAMDYDRSNGVMVLFGGIGAVEYNDTWTYNVTNDTWTEMKPSVSPPPMTGRLVYDPSLGGMVLFKDTYFEPADMWTYNLSRNVWTQLTPSKMPVARFMAGMACDSNTGTIVLFGGHPFGYTLADTWAYNLKRYLPSGNFTSQPIDSSGAACFGELRWNATVPANTTLTFQFRTADTEAGLNSTPFIGPDGTNKTCYNTTGQGIFSGHNGSRWFQYRAYLCTTEPGFTPLLRNVTINYNLLPENATLNSPYEGAWSNDSRPLFGWNFSDRDSSVAGFQWQLDDSSLFDSIILDSGQVDSSELAYQPENPIADGAYYWRVRTLDSDGGWGPYCAGRLLRIDASPPESFQPIASPPGWTNGTIQVSFETTDAFAGMDHYEVEIDGLSQGAQASPFTLPPLSDGEHNITVRAFDRLWNYAIGQLDVFQDRTPPLAFAPAAEPPGWTNGSPRITFETSDASSGVERYRVSVGGGAFSCQTSPFTLPTLPDGRHNITVRAFDRAGNFMDGAVIVYLDSAGPFNFSISLDFTGWTNKDPNITFHALDNTSEIDRYDVKLPGAGFACRTSPFQVPDLPDGRHNITIRAYDRAANCAEATIELFIDKTPPANFTPVASPASWTNQDPDITFSTVDNTSGVSRYEVGLADKNLAVRTSPCRFANLSEGRQEVVVRAYDVAGNCAEGTVPAYIDRTPPGQIFLKINEGRKETAKTKVSLSILASDNLSGLDSICFSTDGILFLDWEPFAASKAWNLTKDRGSKTIYLKVRDKAGNVADPVSATIKYSPPATGGVSYLVPVMLLLLIVAVAAVGTVGWRALRKRKAGAIVPGPSATEAEEAPPPPVGEEAPPKEPEKEPEPSMVGPLPGTHAIPAKSAAEALPPPTIIAPVAEPSPAIPATVTVAPAGFAVEDLFLMYQDGRLIQHTTRRMKADMDADLMASMLTAVKAFIKESVGMAEGTELGAMEYGENKILLQKGRRVVLAAVIEGAEPPGFRDEMKGTVSNVESEFGPVLESWDGRALRLDGARRFLSQLGAYKAAEAATAPPRADVLLKSELEFYQGFVRLKVAVKNNMQTNITRAAFTLMYNESVLRLDRVEPECERKGEQVVLGIVDPGEKRTVAFYLDPQTCTESYVEGVLTFKDAHGNLETLKMPRKLASVVCPIMYTDENINTAMIKRMAAEELDKKDTKVFSIPPSLAPEIAFDLAEAAVQHHDVRLVREFAEERPFIGEAWYYGKAKGRPDRLVIRARVLGEKKVLEFFVASSSTLMLTGMLAELKSDLNRELETQKGRPQAAQVTEPEAVAAVANVRTLLDKASEQEMAAGETETKN